jgi:hypothetical protein
MVGEGSWLLSLEQSAESTLPHCIEKHGTGHGDERVPLRCKLACSAASLIATVAARGQCYKTFFVGN